MTPDELPLLRAESFCFVPEVWTNYPDGKVTVRDAIVPTPYETCEERKPIKWTVRAAPPDLPLWSLATVGTQESGCTEYKDLQSEKSAL